MRLFNGGTFRSAIDPRSRVWCVDNPLCRLRTPILSKHRGMFSIIPRSLSTMTLCGLHAPYMPQRRKCRDQGARCAVGAIRSATVCCYEVLVLTVGAVQSKFGAHARTNCFTITRLPETAQAVNGSFRSASSRGSFDEINVASYFLICRNLLLLNVCSASLSYFY